MPDEGQRPRTGPGGGEEPDHTREFDPFAEDDTDVAPGGGAGTGGAAGEPPTGPSGSGTGREPGADRTADYPPMDDRTAALPPEGDRTAPYQPVESTRPLPSPGQEDEAPDNPRWSGRAGVPPPAAARMRGAAPEDWEAGEERPDRRWWMPILLGILALFLFAILALGAWLIARSRDGGGPSPSPSAPAFTTASAVTSAAPTSAQPSASPTSAAAVTMPPLVGLPQNSAQALLDQLGLGYRLQFRPSNRPAGTVVATDPEAGAPVASGATVTLVIAEQPTAPTTTAAATPTGLPTLLPTLLPTRRLTPPPTG